MRRIRGGIGCLAGFLMLSVAGGCTAVPGSEDFQANASLTGDTTAAAPSDTGAPAPKESATKNLLKLAADIEARGSIATALPLYERAAAEPDADASVHVALGEAYFKVGRDNEAAESYRRAIAMAPEYGRALFGLGSFFLRTGQTEAGLKMLEKAAPQVNTPQAYDRLGVAHMMTGQPREALASFEQAYGLDNRDPDIATNLALAAALLNQRDRSLTLARQTLTYANVQPYHRRNLVLALGISGKPDEAKAAAAQGLPAGDVDALVLRANTIRKISSPKERALALGTVRLAAAR